MFFLFEIYLRPGAWDETTYFRADVLQILFLLLGQQTDLNFFCCVRCQKICPWGGDDFQHLVINNELHMALFQTKLLKLKLVQHLTLAR